MLDKFYKQFKSGTDIRGVASEGVEGQPVNLTMMLWQEWQTALCFGFQKRSAKLLKLLQFLSVVTAEFQGRILYQFAVSVLSAAAQQCSIAHLRLPRQCL